MRVTLWGGSNEETGLVEVDEALLVEVSRCGDLAGLRGNREGGNRWGWDPFLCQKEEEKRSVARREK